MATSESLTHEALEHISDPRHCNCQRQRLKITYEAAAHTSINDIGKEPNLKLDRITKEPIASARAEKVQETQLELSPKPGVDTRLEQFFLQGTMISSRSWI